VHSNDIADLNSWHT